MYESLRGSTPNQLEQQQQVTGLQSAERKSETAQALDLLAERCGSLEQSMKAMLVKLTPICRSFPAAPLQDQKPDQPFQTGIASAIAMASERLVKLDLVVNAVRANLEV